MSCVRALISKKLYNAIKREKKRLQDIEKNKRKRKKKRITMRIASNSIANKIR